MPTKAIILDLDDTIFKTRSMDPKVFQPFFDHLILKLKTHVDQQSIENIVHDLWQRPFDVVLKKHNIPFTLMHESIELLENLDLDLQIKTFQDYTFIKSIQAQLFLVTKGPTTLQMAKIKALEIENDFDKIIINDLLKEARTKYDIFKDLKDEFDLNPETTYVIGDNAESEIAAGNALNSTTIQILRDDTIKGDNAKHYIHSFNELPVIIN